MPSRTKRRAKFQFAGQAFVWWVDGDRYLRICSADKKFVVAFHLVADVDAPAVLDVIGQEFPGIDTSKERPIRLVVPHLDGRSMGAMVDGLLRWVFEGTALPKRHFTAAR